jgi:hypothetical protein
MLQGKCVMKKAGTLVRSQPAPSSRQRTCPYIPEATEFVTNNNMVIIPHPPKLKMKLKGRRFETVSNIQRELQAVLNSIEGMTTTLLLNCGKK